MKIIRKKSDVSQGLKLSAYSLLAVGYLATPKTAEAQINYTDIVPDVTVDAGFWVPATHELDLNADGVMDIRFFAYSYVITHSSAFYSSDYLSAFGLGGNVELAGSGFLWGSPLALNPSFGMNIGSSLSFFDDGILRQNGTGHFSLGSDGFLAFRINEPDGYHYGWIRVEATSPTTVNLKEFAYNTTAGESIPAGKYCDPPLNLTSTVTLSSVDLNWDAALHADNYIVFGRKVGVAGFEKVATSGTSVSIPLLTNGNYEWTVKSVCESGLYKSQVASPDGFTIGPVPKPVSVPLKREEHTRTE